MAKVSLKVVVFLILLAGIIAFTLFSKKIFVSRVVEEIPLEEEKENFLDEDWFVDNCKCVERERFVCGFPGYEFINGLCRSGKNVTNPIGKCSKYDCGVENYSFIDGEWKK